MRSPQKNDLVSSDVVNFKDRAVALCGAGEYRHNFLQPEIPTQAAARMALLVSFIQRRILHIRFRRFQRQSALQLTFSGQNCSLAKDKAVVCHRRRWRKNLLAGEVLLEGKTRFVTVPEFT
jgi:hypothetical protein